MAHFHISPYCILFMPSMRLFWLFSLSEVIIMLENKYHYLRSKKGPLLLSSCSRTLFLVFCLIKLVCAMSNISLKRIVDSPLLNNCRPLWEKHAAQCFEALLILMLMWLCYCVSFAVIILHIGNFVWCKHILFYERIDKEGMWGGGGHDFKDPISQGLISNGLRHVDGGKSRGVGLKKKNVLEKNLWVIN